MRFGAINDKGITIETRFDQMVQLVKSRERKIAAIKLLYKYAKERNDCL